MVTQENGLTDAFQLIRRLADCGTVAEVQQETMQSLATLFEANTCVFTLHPGKRDHPGKRLLWHGIDAEYESLYHERYAKENPFVGWTRAMRAQWECPVARPISFIKRIRETSFYSEFMDPNGMHHPFIIGMLSMGEYVGLIGLYRSKAEPDYNDNDVLMGQTLATGVQLALERALLNERLNGWHWIADAIDTVPRADGLIVLDDNWQIHYRNAVATELLGKLREASVDGERGSQATLPNILLAHCVREVEANPKETDQTFELELPACGLNMSSRLIRVDQHDGRSGYLLSLQSKAPILSKAERLSHLGLTEREIDVVNAVSDGMKSLEVSEKLFISLHTVQSHLKSIYRKLGVNNRASLLSRVNQSLQ